MKQQQTVIIENSPVKFVIAGPSAGRDRLLVRSKHAGFDLIAASTQFRAGARKRNPVSMFSVAFRRPPVNALQSREMSDLDPARDFRSSRFSFTWSGYATEDDLEDVQKIFDFVIADLYAALRDGDQAEIEWVLAPLIHRCGEAHQRMYWRRLTLLALGAFIFALYGSLIVNSIVNEGRRPGRAGAAEEEKEVPSSHGTSPSKPRPWRAEAIASERSACAVTPNCLGNVSDGSKPVMLSSSIRFPLNPSKPTSAPL
jgi:hypothetical protein